MPKWFGKRADGSPLPDNGARFRVTTDDAVFELCVKTASHRHAGRTMLAYRQGSMWHQVLVDNRRIRSIERINQEAA